jgi:hypothetical protein
MSTTVLLERIGPRTPYLSESLSLILQANK